MPVIPFGVYGLPSGAGYLSPGVTIIHADRRAGLTTLLSEVTKTVQDVVVYAPNARDYVHVEERNRISRSTSFDNRIRGRRPELIVIDFPPENFYSSFDEAMRCHTCVVIGGEGPFWYVGPSANTFDLRFVGNDRVFYLTRDQPYTIRRTHFGLEAQQYRPVPLRNRFEIMDAFD